MITEPIPIELVEVGPRDGLQSLIGQVIPNTELKKQWIERLLACGLTHIEVGAFVHPQKVPAMADTAALLPLLPNHLPHTQFRVLVPNVKGLERALNADAKHIAIFTAASNGFTEHNIGQTIDQSLTTYQHVVPQALEAGLTVRGYVSTVVYCPYEGQILPEAVVAVTEALLGMGCYQVSLGETLGSAYPSDIDALLVALQQAGIPMDKLAIHAHDTYGRGVVNTLAAVDAGIRTIDASAGGIGGCPFAPGALGNVATEAVMSALPNGYTTGVDQQKLEATTAWFNAQRGLDP